MACSHVHHRLTGYTSLVWKGPSEISIHFGWLQSFGEALCDSSLATVGFAQGYLGLHGIRDIHQIASPVRGQGNNPSIHRLDSVGTAFL